MRVDLKDIMGMGTPPLEEVSGSVRGGADGVHGGGVFRAIPITTHTTIPITTHIDTTMVVIIVSPVLISTPIAVIGGDKKSCFFYRHFHLSLKYLLITARSLQRYSIERCAEVAFKSAFAEYYHLTAVISSIQIFGMLDGDLHLSPK